MVSTAETSTQTVTATQEIIFATVTVAPNTLTSVQLVIVTTTSVKAAQPNTPSSVPPATSSTTATHPNPPPQTSASAASTVSQPNAPQTSGPPATSNVKTSQPSQPNSISAPSITPFVAPLITLGGSIYTANPSSDYIIGSQTLIPGGPPITVSGTVYSLSPGATKLIIGVFSTNAAGSVQVTPTTRQLTPTTITGSSTGFLTSTASGSLGPVICSGLGGCESSTITTSGVSTFTGEAAIWRKAPSRQKAICAIGVAIPGILLF